VAHQAGQDADGLNSRGEAGLGPLPVGFKLSADGAIITSVVCLRVHQLLAGRAAIAMLGQPPVGAALASHHAHSPQLRHHQKHPEGGENKPNRCSSPVTDPADDVTPWLIVDGVFPRLGLGFSGSLPASAGVGPDPATAGTKSNRSRCRPVVG
jgi:hypothetical protein